MSYTDSLLSDAPEQIIDLLKKCFSEDAWVLAYIENDHHGFEHGNKVREAVFKIFGKLTPEENRLLLAEGEKIDPNNPEIAVRVALTIAALFHDSGRLNERGEFIKTEQAEHHIIGAQKAKKFCEALGLDAVVPYVQDAVESHDFQSRALTPNMRQPQTMIGKIIQSVDQMGWFHPGSVQRTLNYNADLPFFDPNISMAERLTWKPNGKTLDAMSVLLSQLFGPRGQDRFAIQAAQVKVAKYVEELRQAILQAAEERGVKAEVNALIQAREDLEKQD